MEIIIQLALLAFGFLMLVKGADWFVEGAAGIAEKFGIPQLVVGLTIVAMGTSAPEAAVSITAAMKENADITVGNVVGSNILNILIILGITSAIVTVAVAKSTVKIEIPDAATAIAKAVGVSQRFIGLTIVALGTSLPELVTSVSAARKGKADIAIGNIVGSNIFNILFVVGTTALITPVVFASNFLIDTAIAAAAGLLLWICVVKDRKLSRPGGILMLLCYGGYFIYLLQ